MTEALTVGVTGAGGYIGSRVSKLLLEGGHDIVPIDNFYNAQIEEIKGQEIEEVDVRSRKNVEDRLGDSDIILHLAAISNVDVCQENPDLAFTTNMQGTLNVMWVCRKNNIPAVFPLSMQALDTSKQPITSDHPRSPSNLYGLSKVIGEENIGMLSRGSFPAKIFVKSNVYGSHIMEGKKISKGTVINFFVNKGVKGEDLTVHKPGTQVRDFIHVKDVSRAYVKSLELLKNSKENKSSSLVIASGENRTIRELAELVKNKINKKTGKSIGIEMVENPRKEMDTIEELEVDTTKTEKELGFSPQINLEEGIEEMISNAE